MERGRKGTSAPVSPRRGQGSISSPSPVNDDFLNLRHLPMTSFPLMNDPKPHPTYTPGDCFQYSYKYAPRPLRRMEAAVRLERVFGDFYDQASDFPARPTRRIRQEQGGVILEYVLSRSRRGEKVPNLASKPPPGPLRV